MLFGIHGIWLWLTYTCTPKPVFFLNFFAESAGFAPRNNCVLAYITYLSVIADLVVIMINAKVAHG